MPRERDIQLRHRARHAKRSAFALVAESTMATLQFRQKLQPIRQQAGHRQAEGVDQQRLDKSSQDLRRTFAVELQLPSPLESPPHHELSVKPITRLAIPFTQNGRVGGKRHRGARGYDQSTVKINPSVNSFFDQFPKRQAMVSHLAMTVSETEQEVAVETTGPQPLIR